MTTALVHPDRGLCAPWHHPLLGGLQSRVVMTAMTRSMATPDHHATPAMAAYYARRAAHGVGLILTESTAVTALGGGFPNAPRLETTAEAESWRAVTSEVHAAGGKIFSQLLHCGRISDAEYTDGAQPVSATARPASGVNRRTGRDYPDPRALSRAEIRQITDQFVRAAGRAMAVGFDGVELHLAHGYLVDQFFDARVNDRRDEYGVDIPGRCRFGLELVQAVIAELGDAHVMVRISPSRWMGGTYDWPDLDGMIGYLIPALHDVGLRMLDVSCARAEYHETSGRVVGMIRPLWPHLLIAGASLPADAAQIEIAEGRLDMVTYGRWLIANPDLVERWRDGRLLEEYHPALLGSLS